MLATPLLLIMPIISRVADAIIPGLAMDGPEDLHLFVWGMRIANVVSVACAAWLYSTQSSEAGNECSRLPYQK